jgi:hypothetical protein
MSTYEHEHHEHKHKDKCCDACDKRMQGIQGPQGVQGPRGQDGLQGPQGIAGPQGIPGNCVNCFEDRPTKCCDQEFAEVYSVLAQTLAASPGVSMAGQVVLLENAIYATPGIDITNAAITGQIKINAAGWYDATIGVTGSLNPIPSPLPAWTVSLFKNGVLVAGSTFANLPLSPEQHANECVSDVFVHCDVGDMLEIANTSTAPLFLSSPSIGTNAIVNSATFKIKMLKAD